jgi:hypothetical protein
MWDSHVGSDRARLEKTACQTGDSFSRQWPYQPAGAPRKGAEASWGWQRLGRALRSAARTGRCPAARGSARGLIWGRSGRGVQPWVAERAERAEEAGPARRLMALHDRQGQGLRTGMVCGPVKPVKLLVMRCAALATHCCGQWNGRDAGLVGRDRRRASSSRPYNPARLAYLPDRARIRNAHRGEKIAHVLQRYRETRASQPPGCRACGG